MSKAVQPSERRDLRTLLVVLVVGAVSFLCGLLTATGRWDFLRSPPQAGSITNAEELVSGPTEAVETEEVAASQEPVSEASGPAAPVPVVGEQSSDGWEFGWEAEWYWSPFRDTTDLLTDEATHETFAEPGMFPGMGDAQTAWDIMQDAETVMLVPEAGYHYFATGGYCIDWLDPEASKEEDREVRSHVGCFPLSPERIYLTVVRGYPSDGGDVDFNQRVVVYDYVRATGIHHAIGAGAYVSLDWILDQIENAYEPQPPQFEDPNCGDNGCDFPFLVVIDLTTLSVRVWQVGPGLRDWTRVPNWSALSP